MREQLTISIFLTKTIRMPEGDLCPLLARACFREELSQLMQGPASTRHLW